MKERPIIAQPKRALTAEQAVGKILNAIYEANGHTQWGYVKELAALVGMEIRVRSKGVVARLAKRCARGERLVFRQCGESEI